MDIRAKLIEAGLRNLRDYGYEYVTADNILTDAVYSRFFLSMLRDNLGQGFDKPINGLIAEIEPPTPEASS